MIAPWHQNDPGYVSYWGDGPDADPWWWTDEEDALAGIFSLSAAYSSEPNPRSEPWQTKQLG